MRVRLQHLGLVVVALAVTSSGAVRADSAYDALIDLWSEADARCADARGAAAVQSACGERDRLVGRLRQTGLCATYDAAAARETWHSCETDADRVVKPTSSCIIADPTPTPLNVRTMPYGAVIRTIENGSHVHIIDERADQSGNSWVYVADSKPLGWVYKKYVLCKP